MIINVEEANVAQKVLADNGYKVLENLTTVGDTPVAFIAADNDVVVFVVISNTPALAAETLISIRRFLVRWLLNQNVFTKARIDQITSVNQVAKLMKKIG